MNNTQAVMINLTINGQAISVPKGTTVYHAAKQLGIDIPIFCYQDRMPPFGACRMCLVEVEKMPKLQASCTLEVMEGMVVRTQSEQAVKGRESILEFLLINHPLDCPICDKGGECPLQDNTLKCGPGQSRFYEEKRHFKKPIPLGPVLMLDRERCIACARCTRFGDLIAGDHALEFIDRGFKTEVGTPDGGPAESKFIGNTIMICPVGALTSDVYRFRARPWDNISTPTSCTLCPVGCSMKLDSRDGEVMRTRSCENRAVNDIWLCDKGWFGYEFTSHQDRLKSPLIKRQGDFESISWKEALAFAAAKIKNSISTGLSAGFGGNPLTTEENYLFQKWMRSVCESNHVDHRIGTPLLSLAEEGIAAGMEMPIGACEDLSFAVLAGCDITEEFPVIWLRLKQAINRGAKVIFIGHYAPEIYKKLFATFLHAPDDEEKAFQTHLNEISQLVDQGKKGAFFVGSQYLSSANRHKILLELLKWRRPHVSINIMEGKGNSMGARLAGMHPELAPLEREPKAGGLNALQVLERAAAGEKWDFLHIAGADPATKFPEKLWQRARSNIHFLLVQDLFLTETARQADLVLPVLSFAEKEGTFTNIEGRMQALRRGKNLLEGVYSDADIFILLAKELGKTLEIDEAFWQTLRSGQVAIKRPEKMSASKKTEGRTEKGLRASFAPALFDHGARMRHNVHLMQLAKEPRARIHPDEGKKLGLNDEASVQICSSEGAIAAKIKLDATVAGSTVVLPLGFESMPVHNLSAHLLNGLPVEILKV